MEEPEDSNTALIDDDFKITELVRRARPSPRSASPVAFAAMADEWLCLLASQRLSRAHQAKQRQAMRELAEITASSDDLTPRTVALYAGLLMDRKLRRSSIKSNLACVRTFLEYSINRGWIAGANPVDSRPSWIPRNYQGRDEPEASSHLTSEGVRLLLVHLRAGSDTWEGRRLFAVVVAGLATGLRTGAILRIEVDDFDPNARRIRTPKARRPIPIGASPASVLTAWAPESACKWLFPGVQRLGAWTGGVYGTRPTELLRAAGQAIGYGRLTFDSLREYYHYRGASPDLLEGLIPDVPPGSAQITPVPDPTDLAEERFRVELGRLTKTQVKVVLTLKESGPEGATGATIRVKSGVPGWREIMDRLARSSIYWGERIEWPLKGGKHYKFHIL